jgi:hypothetical protein
MGLKITVVMPSSLRRNRVDRGVRMAVLAALNSSRTSQARVTSLTDDVLEFSHDDTRPMGLSGYLKGG